MGKLDGSEKVLAAPRDSLAGLAQLDGLMVDRDQVLWRLDTLLACSHWMNRTRELEDDPSWLQLIPYGVLACQGKVFAYRRVQGSEDRLAGKLSLGVGGHCNPIDARGKAPGPTCLVDCLRREIDEEVMPARGFSIELAGLLADDSSPVNRVHLGVVYRVTLEDQRIVPAEEIEPFGWQTPAQWRETAANHRWETWSRRLLDHLDTLAGVTATSR